MAVENQDVGVPAPVVRPGGVGALLRETREKQGQNLGFVATALRIRQPYLEAIEDGRSEDLPGATYAVGFVRGYADYLGLDSKEIVRRFRQENGEISNRAELVFPSAVSEGSIPTGALLAVAVIAAAAVYGGWYWYQSRDASVASAVSALPERLAALIHRPVDNGSELVPVDNARTDDNSKVNEVPQPPVAVAPSSTPVVPAQPAATPAPSLPVHEDVVPPSEDDTGASSAAAMTPSTADGEAKAPDVKVADVKQGDAGKSRGKDGKAAKAATPSVDAAKADDAAKPADAVPAGPGRVVLRAQQDCWIQIRDDKGKIVQNRLLRKGEVYAAPNRPGMTMTVGNAGALAVLVDGQATGSLGRIGMVRREVPLDAERLKDGLPPAADPNAAAEPSSDSAPQPATPAQAGGVPGSE